MVRPSALAVVRLMTNSNLVDCSTGKIAKFFPLQNPADIDAGLTKGFSDISRIAYQATSFDELTSKI